MPNTDTMTPAQDMAGASMWRPLRHPAFRALWTAGITSNIGTWMQSVGAAWLMTTLTPSPLLVALMQTATSLPIFLVGLPAGTLADVLDRRTLLLVTTAWMLLAALVLGLLTLLGQVSAWSLLAFTFLLGLGAALNGPAWQAILPDLVERPELPSAVALDAMGFNVARAVVGQAPRAADTSSRSRPTAGRSRSPGTQSITPPSGASKASWGRWPRRSRPSGSA